MGLFLVTSVVVASGIYPAGQTTLELGRDYFELELTDVDLQSGMAALILSAFDPAKDGGDVAYLLRAEALDRLLISLQTVEADRADLLDEVTNLRDTLAFAEDELRGHRANSALRQAELWYHRAVGGACTVAGLIQLLKQ
jgi:hypothetical protein